jgi:hypothetical protein
LIHLHRAEWLTEINFDPSGFRTLACGVKEGDEQEEPYHVSCELVWVLIDTKFFLRAGAPWINYY